MVSKKNHSKKNHNFAKYIYVISMDIPTNKEKLFNTIYTTEHIPYIMKIPGIYSVNQFKTVPANFNKTSLLNLNGTKYFILVLDDYNQNHINNGLITITELSKTLPLPSY